MSYVDLEKLKGYMISSVSGMDEGGDEIVFKLSDGRAFKMYHEQSCCERVSIDDVCGEVCDLVDAEIVHFEERVSDGEPQDDYGTSTWTFYDIQTSKGSVNIKWFGSSNGYYSESVNIEWIEEE